MADWIAGLEGTPDGRTVAMALALLAAVSHAVFGALQKGRHDPWLTRGAIDISYALMALPVALFLVPWPEGRVWALLGGAMAIHLGYKLAQAMAYSRGAFTVVYPIVRGTGPLVTVAAAGVVFGEHFSPLQWAGVALLSGGDLRALGRQHRGDADRPRRPRPGGGAGSPHRRLRRRLHHLRRLRHPGDAEPVHLPRLVLRCRRADLPVDRAGALLRDARPAGAGAAASAAASSAGWSPM